MTEWISIKDSVPNHGDRVLFWHEKENKCYQMLCMQDEWMRESWRTHPRFPYTKWKLLSKLPDSLTNDCPFPYVGET